MTIESRGNDEGAEAMAKLRTKPILAPNAQFPVKTSNWLRFLISLILFVRWHIPNVPLGMNETPLLQILSKTGEKVKAVIFFAQSPKCWLPGCFVKLPAGQNKWAWA